MIFNFSGGAKTNNVLSIMNGESGATITATLGGTVLTTETDSSGYAFFTNLDDGTWTIQATKTGRYVPATTVTVSSTQTAYFIKYPFQTYAYNGSLNEGGSTGANVCTAFSGGWSGYGSGGSMTYGLTEIVRNYDAQGYPQYLYNNSAIDLTPFSTLYITCSGAGTVGVATGKDMNNLTYYVSKAPSAGTNSLDVSSFENVSGYIVLGPRYGKITMSAAWFE